ncbi:MAG: hypothetical protein PUG13_03455 [Streptococcus hyointestinalis]|nr:hypothetical protein [Streptococcus hyointestinalis]MDD6384453.1 hypothetical protein [Streptococcus hyointestinalis]
MSQISALQILLTKQVVVAQLTTSTKPSPSMSSRKEEQSFWAVF